MPEAYYQTEGDSVGYTPVAAVSGGTVVQLPDGRAAVVPVDLAAGELGSACVKGIHRIAKTTGMVFLDGGRVFWDYSANAAHYKQVNDRDFYVGRAAGDTASAATEIDVAFNVDPRPRIDLLRDGFLSVATGTQALGGFLPPQDFGDAKGLSLTATSEAQCVDMLSVDRVALSSNPIAEFVVRIGVNGSTSAVDITFGLANGTSTTDADAIAESVFFHIDGGSTAILAESDDGTTEVAATDTTTTFTAGSAVANRKELWIDGRDPSDMKFYVDGVEVLNGTANLGNIALATGPLGLLVHLEKTTGTATAGPVYVDRAELRIME
jgi:predicted RecA/RadA family phage recombinase